MIFKLQQSKSFLSLLTLLFLFCLYPNNYAYEKQKDGVLFELTKQKATDAQWLKIQICTEDIIRFIASPTNSFSTRASLMIVNSNRDIPNWSLRLKNGSVEISTSKVSVVVDTTTGAVEFYDAKGNLLLHEKTKGGKIITSADVMGEQTYHVRQIFDTPDDEAFYGLGQHQNDILNYKGHDVDLWQYNIVDIVPFLVTNKNYGILWDNNSRTKLGDIREYGSLSTLKLFGKTGIPG